MKKLILIILILLTANSAYAVTRFYLRSTGSPAVYPAYGAWTRTTSADALRCSTSREGSAMVTRNATSYTGAGIKYILMRQFVSDPIIAQSISGTIKGVVRCAESNGGLSATIAVSIRVVDRYGNDNATALAISASDLNTTSPPEFLTSLTSRRLQDVSENFSLSLTPVSANEGDRIVIELGYGETDTTPARFGSMSFGDNAATDLRETQLSTEANNPWLEFSQDIIFTSALMVYPNGGEVLTAGRPYTLQYNISGEASYVVIKLSSNEGTSWDTTVTTEAWTHNSGINSYTWTTPIFNSTNCRISVEARSNSTTSDATSASKFELRITTPTVEVKTPNGGEVLNAGAKYNITYLITGDSNPVNIRLTTNEGASWPHLLTTESWSHNGLCTYEWTVNSLISTECRISVEAKGTNWGYDKSNAKFQIRNIASSTDVWVSPTGSDGTGDGTTSSPFKTVAFALTKVLTGGTIKAYGGTYNEYNITWPNINNLTLKASLETSPVTIDAGGVLEQRCLILNYVLNVTLEGVTLKGGRTNGHGGGIYIGVTQAGANLWLNKVNIRYCSAESGGSYGGAVYCNWGAGNEELVIVRANSCVFENNFAYNSGGVAMSGTWEVSNSIFRNNSSISGGGGVFASIYGYGPWSITNCTFESNFSYSGGVGSNAPLWAKNSLFKNNSASYYAGVYSGIGMTVTNCAFDGNSTSGSVGGGISYFYTNYGPVASYIINCTFYNNSAPNGPGGVVRLDHSDGFGEYVPSWESYNCIYYGNSAQSDAVFAGTPSGSTPFKIRYSDIQSNDFEPGTGNISKEPMFVSASTGDFSLLSTSECINTGTQEGAPTDDIIGTSRPQGAGYDMGAFEYVTQVALPEVPAVATKFFLPSSGAAEVSPGFSAWTDTTGADRIRCVVNKIYSAFATKGTNAGAGAGTYLNRQYVSDPIAPQTISGYVSGEIRGRYSGTVASPSSEITIKIVSNDGQTVRGTLLALTGGNTEYGTSLTSYWIPPCTALTQVTAQNGDRLVFEIGGNRGAGSSTPTITQDFGDSGTTDEVETQTTQGNPWIGFSQSILFPSATIIK